MKVNTRIKIMLFILIFMLSSCSGAVELQEMGIVMGIGVDVADGAEDMVKVTVEVANYSEDSSRSSDTPLDNVFSAEGRTITEAINNLNYSVDKYLFWGHNKVIIFGEDMLDDGINHHIDAFIRNAEMRPTAFIIACRGKAAEIFEGKSGLAISVSFGIAGLLDRNGKQSLNKKLGCNVQEYSENMLNIFPAAVLPYVKIKENANSAQQIAKKEAESKKEIEIGGYFVISADGKKAYELNALEQIGTMLWRNKLEAEIITVESGEQRFSLEIYSPDIKIEYADHQFSIIVAADCKMYEAFMPEKINMPLDIDAIALSVEDELEKAVISAFNAEIICREDFLQLGKYIHSIKGEEIESGSDFIKYLLPPKVEVNVNMIFTGEIFNSI